MHRVVIPHASARLDLLLCLLQLLLPSCQAQHRVDHPAVDLPEDVGRPRGDGRNYTFVPPILMPARIDDRTYVKYIRRR